MDNEQELLMSAVHDATDDRLFSTSVFQKWCTSERAAEIFRVASDLLRAEEQHEKRAELIAQVTDSVRTSVMNTFAVSADQLGSVPDHTWYNWWDHNFKR